MTTTNAERFIRGGILTGAAFLLWALGAVSVFAQPPSLLDDPIAERILRELSGVEAKRYVVRLTAWDRIPASPGFERAGEWLREELQSLGIPQVKIESYGPDAPHPFRKTATSLPRWVVHRAELKVIEPFEHLVASYDQLPISIARYSRPASLTAELVAVGKGTDATDYEGRDVHGKVVLATGFSSAVEEAAVGRHGAAGVVVSGGESYSIHKGWGYPQMVTWQVLTPRLSQEREPTFAFSISSEEGERLRRELEAGRQLTVRVDIDAEIEPAPQEIVTALIPGTDSGDEEVLLLAHLDHVRPSANDNASGSALLLEIARTLQHLIAGGQIAPPKRSLRFLWMTEGAGTYGYVNAHPEVRERVVAAINLDMVGEWPLPGMGPLNVRRPPDSLPTYFLDVVRSFVRYLDSVPVRAPTGSDGLINVRDKPWSPDSDHYILNDGALGIPTVFLHVGPDPFHHTNLDAPDKVDPTTLERIGFIAAAASYLVASAGDEEAARIANEVFSEGAARLARAAGEELAMTGAVDPDYLDETYWLAERRLSAYRHREQEAVSSVLHLVGDAEDLTRRLQLLVAGLESQEATFRSALASTYEARHGSPPGPRPLDPAEATAALLRPVRLGGWLNERWRDEIDDQRLAPGDRDWLADFTSRLPFSYIRIPELLNFMDGERSLLEIRDALAAETFDFGLDVQGVGTRLDRSLDARRIAMADVLKLTEIFERCGMVRMERIDG